MSQEPQAVPSKEIPSPNSPSAEGVSQSANPSAFSLHVYQSVYQNKYYAEIAISLLGTDDLANLAFQFEMAVSRIHNTNHGQDGYTLDWLNHHPAVALMARRMYELASGHVANLADLGTLFDCQNLIAGLEVAVRVHTVRECSKELSLRT